MLVYTSNTFGGMPKKYNSGCLYGKDCETGFHGLIEIYFLLLMLCMA